MTRCSVFPFKCLPMVLVLIGLGGCFGQKLAQASSSGNAKPEGWATECVGRWLLDVPGPINFGTATTGFNLDDPKNYIHPELDGYGGGEMLVAGVNVFETAPTTRDGEYGFKFLKNGANWHYQRLDSNVRDKERKAWIKKTTQQVKTREQDALAWQMDTAFDLVFYREQDQRARWFRAVVPFAQRTAEDPAMVERTTRKAQVVLNDLWPRYRPRKPGETPTDAGICTPYGFFADPKGATEQDYAFDMALRDPRYNNLLLNLRVQTRSDKDDDRVVHRQAKALKIEDEVTPWGYEAQSAKEENDKCRPQQGTASRELFGCMFAGTRTIKSHRDVEYLNLANGQKARLLVVEYSAALTEGTEYTVTVETVGTLGSATEPRIEIKATGYGPKTDHKAFQGKSPPPIDKAVAAVRALAQSLRLRPGAIAPNAPVKDSLAGLR